MVKAVKVAELLLSWAHQDGDAITNLKLQKLLYYAQAWHLVNFRKRLFSDDIVAWDFGPVIRPVYNRWKKYKSAPIPYKPTSKEEHIFSDKQITFLREFYKIFSSLSATALVSMSHSEEPWKKAYLSSSKIIDPSLMKSFYTDMYSQIGE